jgi:hypothetical protein
MDNQDRRYILKWELAGIVFIFLLGALLHFVFKWSGESPIVGAFASVNESVWEHFKQGFWPIFLYAIVEFRFIRQHAHNILPAKAVEVYLVPLITGLVFYGYTAVIGDEILIVDIIIFAVAVSIGQLVSYKIMVAIPWPKIVGFVSPVLILLLAAILVVTTFYPPHWPIFMDEAGFYGLP